MGLRGASRSLASVRMASNSKNKPPTTSSDGSESRRWREGAAAPQDAEIAPIVALEIHPTNKRVSTATLGRVGRDALRRDAFDTQIVGLACYS